MCIVFFAACGSASKKRSKEDDRTDSLALVVHPGKLSKEIDAFVEKLHRTRQFNGNVLVARKGKIIYERAIGWADYLHRDSLKINSVFELASVTKPFTATAILLLEEQGKLNLDQNVKEFFSDFPYEGITIRLLLSHRSGMMNYVYFTDDIWKDKMKPMSNMDVMKLADYIIDIGPEGGKGGGEVVAKGTPEEIIKNKKSYTAQFLKKELL